MRQESSSTARSGEEKLIEKENLEGKQGSIVVYQHLEPAVPTDRVERL